jgi:hypothetical protein
MRNKAIIFAGIMVASVAFAGTNDPMAEDRYRSKYGRYTPAEEARKAARLEVKADAAPPCCHPAEAMRSRTVTWSEQEARFAAKYGRPAPSVAAGDQAARNELAAHTEKCIALGHCARSHSTITKAPAVTTQPGESDLRFQAKYGVAPPSVARRAVRSQEPLAAAANAGAGCQLECCRSSD